jgi:hypothetical protein
MDLFKINKYQSKYENILFLAKIVYETIKNPMTIDAIFQSLEKRLSFDISPDIESMVMLSLSFLHSIELIDIDGNNIKRSQEK